MIETVGRASSDTSTNSPARRAAAAARFSTVPAPVSVASWVAAGNCLKKLSAAAPAATSAVPGAGTACQTRIDVFAFHRSSDVLTVVHGRQWPSSPSRCPSSARPGRPAAGAARVTSASASAGGLSPGEPAW